MRRMREIAALAALVFVLAACGGSDDSQGSGEDGGSEGGSGGQTGDTSAQSEPASEVQYTRGQYDLTEDGAADDQYEEAVAEDLPFPVPPESEIIKAGQRPDEAYAAVFGITSGQEAYDFYRQALPDAGFEIFRDSRDNESAGGEGENREQTGEENQEEEQNGEDPFAAFMVIGNGEYRGVIRLDDERAIIGVSRAAVDRAGEVQQRAEERRAEREQQAEERRQEREAEQQEAPEQEGEQGEREAQNQEAVEANPTTDNAEGQDQ